MACDGVEARAFTVTGLGTQLIRGHRIYESTNAYDLVPADGEEADGGPADRGEADRLRY